jgi:hypothetical protein
LNGFVGAMVGGFELAGRLVMGVRAVVKAAVGERAAEPFVKEQEEQGDLNPFWGAFVETYAIKYDKAAGCLTKDREALLAFYDFPAEHWKHLRTTNPLKAHSPPCGDRSGVPDFQDGAVGRVGAASSP